MDINHIIEGLHPLERKVLPFLAKFESFEDIEKASKLKDVEVMRALQWMENKNLLKIKSSLKEVIKIDELGLKYAKEGLPEKIFLKKLTKPVEIKDLEKTTGLNKDEVSISLGLSRKKGLIKIDQGRVFLTDAGKQYLEKESLEEKFIKKVSQKDIETKELSPEEQFAYNELKKRKNIIKTQLLTIRKVELTDLGKGLLKENISEDLVDSLTPEMLKTGSWKNKKFRRYDLKINVPKINYGRKQHYRNFLDEVRKKFVSLGFEEMNGPIVESEFFDMDALFMPQSHSARDIHAAYYVKEPKYTEVNNNLIKKVKLAHEKGVAGSKGWGYEFDEQRTKRTLLRTQGTACSARMLSSKDFKIPGKYFGITRCFRYDVIDATHNCDFYQTEGIVAEEGLTLKHLFGLLKMFAKEFADADQVKLVPGYFPFTEPSVELYAKHPQLGWIELGGAGILRPEVVYPLTGKNIPIIAWGIGIDRIAMFKLGLKDIRQLFSHDLQFLRSAKVV